MWLWLIFGVIAFIFGAIGVFLPIWPTTIFWIIAAFCFANSRPEWRDWIYERPGFGPVIEGFVEHGVLSRTSKAGGILGLVISQSMATFFLWGQWMALGILAATLLLVALFIATRPAP